MRRLQLDPCPHVDVVGHKKRGFLVAVLTIVRTHHVFSQKILRGMNKIFLHLRIFFIFVFYGITLIRAGVAVQGASCTYRNL